MYTVALSSIFIVYFGFGFALALKGSEKASAIWWEESREYAFKTVYDKKSYGRYESIRPFVRTLVKENFKVLPTVFLVFFLSLISSWLLL